MKAKELLTNIGDKKMPGIYMIYCAVDEKAYIGQSKNITKRLAYHRWELNKNKHSNPYLQNVWNKYGPSSFNFIVLENCTKDILTERESYYVSLIDKELIMNVGPIVGVLEISEDTKERERKQQLGKKHTAESLEHMSKVQKERYAKTPMSEETKKKISLAKKGKKMPEGFALKQSIIGSNRVWSDETKKKISDYAKKRAKIWMPYMGDVKEILEKQGINNLKKESIESTI